MTRRYRKREFVPLASMPARKLGLSRARTEHLKLIRSWSEVAGARLASRATPVDLRRGLLRFRLTAADDAWEATLTGLLPSLAARMSSASPGLDIREVQLLTPQGEPIGEPRAVDESAIDVPAPSTRVRRAEREPDDRRPFRLERVMQSYLSRVESDESSD